MRRWIMGALLVLALPVRAEVLVREVFDAPALAQTLREIYPDLGVSHLGNQLVVSGSPAQLAEVASTLETLDRPPAMLTVEWRVVGSRSRQGWQAELKRGKVVAEVGSQQVSSEGNWQVSGLSGRPVLLSLGATRPVTLYGWYGQRWVALVEERQGISAVPTLVGDRVSVALNGSSPVPGSHSHSQIASEVSGGLGEWIELGAISQEEQGQQWGTHSGLQADDLSQRLQIRVTRR